MEQEEYKGNIKPTAFAKAVEKITDLDIMMPVHTRVKNRLRELKKLSSARTVKIMRGHIADHYTEPPKMFIANLGSSIVNGVGTISYQVYKKDGDNKAIEVVTREVINSSGDKVKVDVSAEYIIEKTVIETIEYKKPLKKEELK